MPCAAKAGANEAWLIDDGFVTEGGSSTAVIITWDKRIVTRPLSNALLPGIARRSVMRRAIETGLIVEEHAFTLDEAKAASDAVFTSASNYVVPIVSIDYVQIGDGKPGSLTDNIRQIYMNFANVGRLDFFS